MNLLEYCFFQFRVLRRILSMSLRMLVDGPLCSSWSQLRPQSTPLLERDRVHLPLGLFQWKRFSFRSFCGDILCSNLDTNWPSNISCIPLGVGNFSFSCVIEATVLLRLIVVRPRMAWEGDEESTIRKKNSIFMVLRLSPKIMGRLNSPLGKVVRLARLRRWFFLGRATVDNWVAYTSHA